MIYCIGGSVDLTETEKPSYEANHRENSGWMSVDGSGRRQNGWLPVFRISLVQLDRYISGTYLEHLTIVGGSVGSKIATRTRTP